MPPAPKQRRELNPSLPDRLVGWAKQNQYPIAFGANIFVHQNQSQDLQEIELNCNVDRINDRNSPRLTTKLSTIAL